MDRHSVEQALHFPFARWPGRSHAEFYKRAATFFLMWIMAEVILGALFPSLMVFLFRKITLIHFLIHLDIHPRDVLLICIAVGCAHIPDLIITTEQRRRFIRILLVFLIYMVVIVALIAQAEIEFTPNPNGLRNTWWIADLCAIGMLLCLVLASALRAAEDTPYTSHELPLPDFSHSIRSNAIPKISREPVYLQVAANLRRSIAAGEFMASGRLPSTRALAEKYGIARTTAERAVQVLRTDGLVRTVKGRGVYVV
jgi:hypothetical protein